MSILNHPSTMTLLGFVNSRARHEVSRRPTRVRLVEPLRELKSPSLWSRSKSLSDGSLETLAPPPAPTGSYPEARLCPPRGWYADPRTNGLQRRWDGLGWTPETKNC